MTVTPRFSVARFAAMSRAEFLKIWASRIPLVILVALPLGTYLFVLELYKVEGIGDRIHGNALDALPILFFATWKTLMFQMAMLTFAAFWATVDSQYRDDSGRMLPTDQPLRICARQMERDHGPRHDLRDDVSRVGTGLDRNLLGHARHPRW